MSERGERFLTPTDRVWRDQVRSFRVGAWYGHTVGDREEALAELAQGFEQIYTELGYQIGVLPYEGSAERVKAHPEWYLWWKAAAVPVFDRWTKFHADQTGQFTGPAAGFIGYGERFSTDWDTYKKWRDTLETLRDSAHKIGMSIATPAPEKLRTTPVEDIENLAKRAGDKIAHVGDTALSFAKAAGIGVLVLGGVWGTVEIVKAARSK